MSTLRAAPAPVWASAPVRRWSSSCWRPNAAARGRAPLSAGCARRRSAVRSPDPARWSAATQADPPGRSRGSPPHRDRSSSASPPKRPDAPRDLPPPPPGGRPVSRRPEPVRVVLAHPASRRCPARTCVAAVSSAHVSSAVRTPRSAPGPGPPPSDTAVSILYSDSVAFVGWSCYSSPCWLPCHWSCFPYSVSSQ